MEYITKTDLIKERKWNIKLIDSLLKTPDLSYQDKTYKVIVKLFSVERVKDAELSAEFREAQIPLAKRRHSAQAGVKTKERKLLEEVEKMAIDVEVIDRSKLERLAIGQYEEHKQERSHYYFNDDGYGYEDIIERLMVNYLRHQMTDYHHFLYQFKTKVGKHEACWALKKKILYVIWQKYPYLEEECKSQLGLVEDSDGTLISMYD